MSSRSLTLDSKTQIGWEWKDGKIYFKQKSDITLKWHTQNLTCSRIHDRNNNLLGAWVRPTCWSWNLRRGGKQLQFTLETISIFYIIAFFSPQLYLAVLVLHCYTRAFSSCGEWGLLYTCSVWGFSLLVVSLVSEHGLFQSTQTSVNVVHRHSCCGAKA